MQRQEKAHKRGSASSLQENKELPEAVQAFLFFLRQRIQGQRYCHEFMEKRSV